ncbi:MAG TPA: 3-oxoacyl-[acyl-carrier-protein] synthase III C-terminal domain-containing protein, partial [Acidimicrobiales bacterium]|nr:3-oxoacyl-[acyl-carrier-protein] synthase III C-terminal domain-containing protein [Acidimicrobiales bacterium]
ARALLATGVRRILLIGVDTLSRITDWEDRRTAIIFADGAGAVVLEAADGDDNLLGFDLGSDGTAEGILRADLGGYLRMDGKEVFKRAVEAMVGSCGRTLERAGRTVADVDLVVPHQANARIIEAGLDGLGIPWDKASIVVETVGNTSAASVPLALAAALDQGRVQEGDDVLFVGFGAGMAWASALVRWQG